MLRHVAFAMCQISRELNFSSLEVLTSLRLVQSVPPSDHNDLHTHMNHWLHSFTRTMAGSSKVVLRWFSKANLWKKLVLEILKTVLHFLAQILYQCLLSIEGMEFPFWLRHTEFDKHLAADHWGLANDIYAPSWYAIPGFWCKWCNFCSARLLKRKKCCRPNYCLLLFRFAVLCLYHRVGFICLIETKSKTFLRSQTIQEIHNKMSQHFSMCVWKCHNEVWQCSDWDHILWWCAASQISLFPTWIMETKKLKLAQGTIPSWPKGPGPQNLENLEFEFFFRLSFWFQLAMFANCKFFRFDFWQVRIWYVWTATVYIIWTVSLWVMEIIQQHGRRTEIQTSPGCWEKKPCWFVDVNLML